VSSLDELLTDAIAAGDVDALRSRGGRIPGGTLAGDFDVTSAPAPSASLRRRFTVGPAIDLPPAAMASILDHLRAGEQDAAARVFVAAFNADYQAQGDPGVFVTPVDVAPFVIEPA
jgi:hypothetical protein